MNILPKKRWHVRTKENIARVKQDEAKFEEEKRKKEDRSLLAEQESRTEFLRKQQHARLTPGCSASSNNRVALLSDRSVELIEGNKEYEAEKKAEQEAQEKSIGLLTYLGQSMLDSGGQKPWYDIHPKKRKLDDAEKLK
ncbi:unnamed protein product [Calicophoron daubneyi]|uniref:CBF1-interacting co-repressor CIR N-terminal domain-containing protein n=1 Tax=Calicophoron daubneyi TaxID=300641 RepID=A0AAV2TDB4_CALDB